MQATKDVAIELLPGQVWEGGGRHWRVQHVDQWVSVCDVDSLQSRSFRSVEDFKATHRFVGSPLSDDHLLFRLKDLLNRTGVDDAVLLIDAIERLVTFRQSQRARA